MVRNQLGAPSAPKRGKARASRPATSLLLALVVAGCASAAGGSLTGPAAVAVAPPPTDPLLVFAAGAAPGAEGSTTLSSGVPVRLRLVRSYAAASGAECKEIQELPAGGAERSRLVCREANGHWREARPLLGAGAVSR